MVLVNPTPNSLNADLHYVPSIHLNNDVYAPVTAYAATAGATGAIVALDADDVSTPRSRSSPTSPRGARRPPPVATSSSRTSPPRASTSWPRWPRSPHGGRSYDLISGTSMASPHIAGIAAVIKAVHQNWSPMEIKSAMMTTARDTIGTTSPFDQGAGQVRRTRPPLPGVVFDHGVEDWIGYLIHEGYLEQGDFPGRRAGRRHRPQPGLRGQRVGPRHDHHQPAR